MIDSNERKYLRKIMCRPMDQRANAVQRKNACWSKFVIPSKVVWDPAAVGVGGMMCMSAEMVDAVLLRSQ
jgi:hypothetical protein